MEDHLVNFHIGKSSKASINQSSNYYINWLGHFPKTFSTASLLKSNLSRYDNIHTDFAPF